MIVGLYGTVAHAAYDECAVVLKTPDGFLAMRQGPGTGANMVTKLHRGDVVETEGRITGVDVDSEGVRSRICVQEIYPEISLQGCRA